MFAAAAQDAQRRRRVFFNGNLIHAKMMTWFSLEVFPMIFQFAHMCQNSWIFKWKVVNFSQLLAMLCIVKSSYCTREFYTSDGREMQIAAATFTTQKRFALIRKYCYRGNVSPVQNMYSSWQCRKTSSSCSSITFRSFNGWCPFYAESLVQLETKNANGLNVVVKFIDKKRIEGQGAAAAAPQLHPPLQLQKIESHQKRP